MMRAGADIVGVCHAILHEPHRRGLELAVRLFEPAREIGECLVALGAAAFLIDDREESLDRAAALLRELAADEVHRLPAVRAFIDHRYAPLAHLLAPVLFIHVSVAAPTLLRIGPTPTSDDRLFG